MQELEGRRVLVLGLGISGQSAASFCARQGARVLAVDERAELQVEVDDEVEVQLGSAFPDPAAFDLVVPSPGVPFADYGPRARAVAGDVELAYRALRVPVVAVTGTNGKSTTVRLLEAMLRSAGLRAQAAGNLGIPALDLVGQALDVAVLEVSSFQLEAVDRFRPRVAVWLNLSADHLDRHGSMEGYRDAKLRLFARQQPEDTAILNGDDPIVARVAASLRARVRCFRQRGPVAGGACWDGDALCVDDERGARRFRVDGARLDGPVRANLPAALLACDALGVDLGRALGALDRFEPLPHRGQCVAERGGVRFVDDSKATNPGAAAAAVRGIDGPVWWILGGRDKGLAYDELQDAPLDRVRCALLIGEASEKLASVLAGRVEVVRCETLERAIAHASAAAAPGDTVLLAPACASFDQFASFEERGERFRTLAQEVSS